MGDTPPSLSMDNPEHEEIARLVLNSLLDTVAPREALEDPRAMALAQRRLTVLAFVLARPGYERINGKQIALRYGITKQAVNLDVQHIARTFRIVAPTAHQSTNGRAPGWVHRASC